MSSTTNSFGVSPDDLGEVTPFLEVGHVRGGLSVIAGQEQRDLAVIPLVVDGALYQTDAIL